MKMTQITLTLLIILTVQANTGRQRVYAQKTTGQIEQEESFSSPNCKRSEWINEDLRTTASEIIRTLNRFRTDFDYRDTLPGLLAGMINVTCKGIAGSIPDEIVGSDLISSIESLSTLLQSTSYISQENSTELMNRKMEAFFAILHDIKAKIESFKAFEDNVSTIPILVNQTAKEFDSTSLMYQTLMKDVREIVMLINEKNEAAKLSHNMLANQSASNDSKYGVLISALENHTKDLGNIVTRTINESNKIVTSQMSLDGSRNHELLLGLHNQLDNQKILLTNLSNCIETANMHSKDLKKGDLISSENVTIQIQTIFRMREQMNEMQHSLQIIQEQSNHTLLKIVPRNEMQMFMQQIIAERSDNYTHQLNLMYILLANLSEEFQQFKHSGQYYERDLLEKLAMSQHNSKSSELQDQIHQIHFNETQLFRQAQAEQHQNEDHTLQIIISLMENQQLHTQNFEEIILMKVNETHESQHAANMLYENQLNCIVEQQINQSQVLTEISLTLPSFLQKVEYIVSSLYPNQSSHFLEEISRQFLESQRIQKVNFQYSTKELVNQTTDIVNTLENILQVQMQQIALTITNQIQMQEDHQKENKLGRLNQTQVLHELLQYIQYNQSSELREICLQKTFETRELKEIIDVTFTNQTQQLMELSIGQGNTLRELEQILQHAKSIEEHNAKDPNRLLQEIRQTLLNQSNESRQEFLSIGANQTSTLIQFLEKEWLNKTRDFQNIGSFQNNQTCKQVQQDIQSVLHQLNKTSLESNNEMNMLLKNCTDSFKTIILVQMRNYSTELQDIIIDHQLLWKQQIEQTEKLATQQQNCSMPFPSEDSHNFGTNFTNFTNRIESSIERLQQQLFNQSQRMFQMEMLHQNQTTQHEKILNQQEEQKQQLAQLHQKMDSIEHIIISQINECVSAPCMNNGSCIDLFNSYNCSCIEGSSGLNCEIDVNECDSMPCINNGTCVDTFNGYKCGCQPGFTGFNCETDINECASRPCLNHGTCSDRVNGYICQCAPGYTGINCQTDINECASMPCLNGAPCSDRVNGYSCRCSSGFTGTNCQTGRPMRLMSYYGYVVDITSANVAGRLEIYYGWQWGTVCDDNFGDVAALVACRSLRTDFRVGRFLTPTPFGAGAGPIQLDQVTCHGNETHLELCSHGGWGVHDCQHSEDVAIRCTT